MQRFFFSPGRGLRLHCIRGREKKKGKWSRVLSRKQRERKMRKRVSVKQEEEEEDPSFYFSEEILMEILKRLPIEDLVRCLSVCNSWYSLITSPIFISLHSEQIAASNKGLVLVRDYDSKKPNKEIYSMHFDDEQFGEYKRLHFPIRSWINDSFFRIVGCVNGVVCLSDDIHTYTNCMILWNPSIRKFVDLPRPIFTYKTHGGFDHCIGFGFDDVANDFKVVRVVYLTDRRPIVPPKVEIYEPRVGSWREVDSKGFSRFIDEKSPQVFLHGNVHWVHGCKFEYFNFPKVENMIVSFDLRKEEFGVMEVPDNLNEHPLRQDFCVSVLGESLSLIHHDTPSDNGNGCCIWVMKQYGVPDSWTKLFSVDVSGGYWRVLGFRRNGEAVVKGAPIYHGLRQHLVFLELKNRQLKFLGEVENWKNSLYVDNFVESLALLGAKGDPMLDNMQDDKPVDTDSPEDVSRRQDPAYPHIPNNQPWVEVLVQWFG